MLVGTSPGISVPEERGACIVGTSPEIVFGPGAGFAAPFPDVATTHIMRISPSTVADTTAPIMYW